MKHGIIIRTNGTTERVEPENGIDFTTEELQRIVGRVFDITNIHDNFFMFFNATREDLPFNDLATYIVRSGRWKNTLFQIYGDAFVKELD
jgi:hypothetical protein